MKDIFPLWKHSFLVLFSKAAWWSGAGAIAAFLWPWGNEPENVNSTSENGGTQGWTGSGPFKICCQAILNLCGLSSPEFSLHYLKPNHYLSSRWQINWKKRTKCQQKQYEIFFFIFKPGPHMIREIVIFSLTKVQSHDWKAETEESQLGVIAHACKPSYSGGGGRRLKSSRVWGERGQKQNTKTKGLRVCLKW
jgi:hypothetical protein